MHREHSTYSDCPPRCEMYRPVSYFVPARNARFVNIIVLRYKYSGSTKFNYCRMFYIGKLQLHARAFIYGVLRNAVKIKISFPITFFFYFF